MNAEQLAADLAMRHERGRETAYEAMLAVHAEHLWRDHGMSVPAVAKAVSRSQKWVRALVAAKRWEKE